MTMNHDNQTYEDLILANEKLEAENKWLRSMVNDRDEAEFQVWATEYFAFDVAIGRNYGIETEVARAAWMAARGR